MMGIRSGSCGFAASAWLAGLALAACGGDMGQAPAPTVADPAGAVASPPIAAGAPSPIAGSGTGVPAAPAPIAGQPAVQTPPKAGAPAMPVAGAGPSAAAAAGAGAAGSGASHGAHDHCVDGYLPQPTDETMKDGPADFYPPGNMDPDIVDTTVQPEVLQWMRDNYWQAAHVEWHAIRACGLAGGGGAGLSQVNICSFKQLVPKDQNCQTAGDGYQFLVFHRHMIQALKQLWPKHTEQFTGFTKFPTTAADVPPQWRSAWKDWEPQVLEAGKIGDEIDKPENLARFPNEGALGFWLQCNVGQKLRDPPSNMPFVGLHFVLHAKWARPGNTTHGVNNTSSNIDNYMFWKLHGWIDNVWEKYRRAKGMLPTDQHLKDDLVTQCREMDTEIQIIRDKMGPATPPPATNQPLPAESGFFHEKVRPIFASKTNLCSGCHAETGANAMLTLGGNISSKQIVLGLVDKPSRDGGQYKLVAPGDPDHSWLYLKASGKAGMAGCMPSSTATCMTGTMPPSASGLPTLTATEQQTLRQWIQDGAKGPP